MTKKLGEGVDVMQQAKDVIKGLRALAWLSYLEKAQEIANKWREYAGVGDKNLEGQKFLNKHKHGSNREW